MASAALLVFPELGLSRERRSEFLSNRQKPLQSTKKPIQKKSADNTSKIQKPSSTIFTRTTKFLTDLKAFFISSPHENDRILLEIKPVGMEKIGPSKNKDDQKLDYFNKLPNEVLEEIFSSLDQESVKTMRVVNRRCKNMVDSSKIVLKKIHTKTANRLVIKYVQDKNVYDFRWCNYDTKTVQKICITPIEIKYGQNFSFAFKQMVFQRIMFKNLPNKSLSNSLVNFLCTHFEFCPMFEPIYASFENVDFGGLSSISLNKLLGLCGGYLETFIINNAYGLNRNSINDTHIKQMNPTKIKRLTIQNIKFQSSDHQQKVLKITDKSIQWLMSAGHFPALVFEHCQITTPSMCKYIESWLKKAAQETVDSSIKSHSFMLKHCPSISSEIFEKECIERRLSYSKQSTPENIYTLFNEESSTSKFFEPMWKPNVFAACHLRRN